MKRTKESSVTILIAAVIAVVMCAVFSVHADDKVKKAASGVPLDTKVVKILAKSEGFIHTSDMGFRVKENTRIVDRLGLRISISELPVPCKAEITYRPISTAHPKAQTIVVKDIYPESSTAAWGNPDS